MPLIRTTRTSRLVEDRLDGDWTSPAGGPAPSRIGDDPPGPRPDHPVDPTRPRRKPRDHPHRAARPARRPRPARAAARRLRGAAGDAGRVGDRGPAGSGTTPVASGATYVAVGDSYAAGYQPEGFSGDDGFADQLARRLAGTPQALQLVDLACPGATTASFVDEPGCSAQPDAPGAVAHPGATQLAALEQELTAHAGRVRLVTVVLGGNDVLPCFLRSDARACVQAALPGSPAASAPSSRPCAGSPPGRPSSG